MTTIYQPIVLRASSALATPTTEYSVADIAKKSGTATATTSNKLTDSAGAFTTAQSNGVIVAVGDIVKNTTTGKFALVTAIDSATALSVSADIFSNTNAYTIYPGIGTAINPKATELQVILDVTSAATDAGDTLDVYVDTSFDGGTSFVNIGHFTQVLGNGGAKKFIMAFKANPITASNSVSFTADQAASAALQIGFGDRIRTRAVLVDATTQNASFTFSIVAHIK